jgi:hypothetical protein
MTLTTDLTVSDTEEDTDSPPSDARSKRIRTASPSTAAANHCIQSGSSSQVNVECK